jgi:membrane dipeptidase
VDHVGLGLDYYEGMAGVASDEEAQRLYDGFVSSGTWNPSTYAPPPWHFPDAIRKPSDLPNLTVALCREGFREDEIKKILGLNFVRVFTAVWK